jgi:branched-chain amino acid transport system substrate-binding protein
MTDAPRIVSRREFLKLAGTAGATLGLGAGLGGVVAACGDEETTTTTASSPGTTAAGSTTSTGAEASTTSVSASAETGREIKLGWVAPQTGPLAVFGIPDTYCADYLTELTAEGVICGDGKNHPIKVMLEDSQSNANRSSQVAGDLINNQKVDILMACSSGDNVTPAADQAEAFETPFISTDTPWQAWFFTRGGDPKVGFKWTYHAFWGQEDNFPTNFDMWDQVSTNKKVGVLWANDVDGNNYRSQWPGPMEEAGYTIIDGGSFPDGLEDYSTIIDTFKKEGAEIVQGSIATPDFTTFWQQCQQMSYKPKVVSVSKAMLFPEAANALGDLSVGLLCTPWWHPEYPFTCSLTGESCPEFAARYEEKTGNQWTPPLLHFLVSEWAIDVLKRTPDVDDKEMIVEAIKTTKLETIAGVLDFTQEIGTGTHPVLNVVRTPLSGGQWRKGVSDKWTYWPVLCSNKVWPEIPVSSTVQPLA